MYTLQADKSWLLSNIQGYNTTDYWSYTTYYKTGYDATTVPIFQVQKEPRLAYINYCSRRRHCKSYPNDEGNFSMYELQSDGTWEEVIIEKGTIKFNDSLFFNIKFSFSYNWF